MHSESVEHASARLVTALRIYAASLAMKREQLRRDHPDASDAEVHRRLTAWTKKSRHGRRKRA